ncbi:hypothetical protein V6N13_033098 [Hibiscus sabdariffa]
MTVVGNANARTLLSSGSPAVYRAADATTSSDPSWHGRVRNGSLQELCMIHVREFRSEGYRSLCNDGGSISTQKTVNG